MKSENKVIFFNEKEFNKQVSLHEKLIHEIEGVVNEIKSIGFEFVTMDYIAGLHQGTKGLMEVWRNRQAEYPKNSFEKFQADSFEAHLEKQLNSVCVKIQRINEKCYSDIYNTLPARLDIFNYAINLDGKVVLADSFIEELRDEHSVYCDTPEKVKALDLADKASKALNDLQNYLHKLSNEGAICQFDAVSFTASNTPLVPFDYSTNQFYIDFAMFAEVGMKRNKPNVQPK